ncbi:hypothetical protein CDL15_Pgr023927 [Punica granatum]|uniref:Uncharacterized protein n=1 Tax=Punica granatum TaxID=22663 RepID=A0A218XX37_PUNGR|nr:hypothetical protein CDL15_Pgr023927 [Punica granatum]
MATMKAISVVLIFAMVLMAFAATGEAVKSPPCVGKCMKRCPSLRVTTPEKCPAACDWYCAKVFQTDSWSDFGEAFKKIISHFPF